MALDPHAIDLKSKSTEELVEISRTLGEVYTGQELEIYKWILRGRIAEELIERWWDERDSST